MSLTLYNTLTRKKAPFEPLDAKNVRMYVCGPTVYDHAHIGNARPAIVFDVLFRLLRHLYGEDHVTYVRNITDVDDKINARALRDFPDVPLNDAIRTVTETTAKQYHADVAALGCLEPTKEPRATENISEMIALIEKLVANGNAYEAAGEVLFDTAAMADYGQLSKRNLEDQQAGARVAVEEHKKNAADFVLWKLSSPEEPGWESPWGRGRPGWHIECSAMSQRYLGDIFDIHGGGLDLIFPHHENEIAQSRCALGTDVMARVWMHNGFLELEGEKMSKSLGNFITINELLMERPDDKTWWGGILRLNMLATHYRQPINWTRKSLEEAEKAMNRWGEIARGNGGQINAKLTSRIENHLTNDLNTPAAISELHKMAKDAEAGSKESAHALVANLRFLGLPVDEYEPPKIADDMDESMILDRIAARKSAREQKNWAESDRIRDELAEMGIQLKDAKDPKTGELVTTWEVKR